MNGINFHMPARRWAVVATATALAAGPAAVAGAGSAHASEDDGRASAVVLRTGLDVGLLNKTVNVPLAVSLNEVQAPQSAHKTALTAKLDGVDGGQPFSVLRADVAESKATVTDGKAEGTTRLAHARLHVPGLPLLPLVEVEKVTSKAVCEAGKKPVATSDVPGSVTVLGKKVAVTAGGRADVKVPGVGDVRFDLAKRETTSRTAAATALELSVSVNPSKLNVAQVDGTVTLAKATCEAPAAATGQPPADPSDPSEPGSGSAPQGGSGGGDLAETGANAMTPYLAGGAVALLVAGGGAVALARRKRGQAQ
ncbi:SCO1860 family LAETG-anchored protein [Streptomyces sp. TRM68367]|uniref:SCO1860 family LAETG-anchored protein n=1 Tax=Streptomyces sp. TRM68367 TaxID=2758415 RepID=UPI00165BE046|nr:SCO1860 family LAETG-anchored protein [Streptomyces sp. TRM68367]MBC9726869.1 LPXTG cell wall anchor domain-containing protein [Streptomyces sp. TRM68367]